MLSPLLSTSVLQDLSGEVRSRCLEELLYADGLALVSESLEFLKEILEAWNGALKSKW